MVLCFTKYFIKTPSTFENLLKDLFDLYNLKMTIEQFVLVGSTVKSYLSWLKNKDEIEFYFEQNKMLWRIK